MSQVLDTIASYVPWLVARRFTQDPTPLIEPYVEPFPAAVFFADLSGFSKLAARLAKHGPSGAEELTHILNQTFGALIDLISGHGGDIVKFAGDGLYAIWPTIAHNEDLTTVTRRCIQCSLLIQERLNGLQISAGERLSMRIGIGAGEVLTAAVGGVLKRWELLLAGQPVGQMNAASEVSRPGEVILSTEAWELVAPYCDSKRVHDDFFRLDRINDYIPSRLLAPAILHSDAEEALRGFVAGAILSRLHAGQIGWLAENRRVTVLFVSIDGLNQNTPNVTDRMQDVMQQMQVTLYHYQGSVRQFIMDDKGTVFIAAFGVPPLTHEDDPLRGVQAALAMQAKLKELDLESSIGVATGLAFCGPVGNQLRREYAMVGETVVLSARLMAARRQSILCDEATYQATHTRLKYAKLRPIQVKNRVEPVQIYSPRGKAQVESSLRPVIGREPERDLLTHSLDLLEQGENTVVLIRGEQGIGKTRLITDLIEQANARRIEVLMGEADSIDRATPYHGWRGVLSQMFHMDNFTQTRARSLAIIARLASDPELSNLAPLLNAILPLDIPETDLTKAMSGQARAENTRHLLLRLLGFHSAQAPSIIVLENGQWLDSASWALALAASQQMHPLLLIIAMRPLANESIELQQLLESPITQQIDLQPLTSEETHALVRQRLGAAILPQDIRSLFEEKARGNPFFLEQMAYALRDSEYIEMVDGECRLAPGVINIPDVDLPDTIQGVITSRIDRLPPQQQLTLKVASAIGPIFSFRTLHDVYPITADKDQLSDHLSVLEKLDLIEVEMPAPDLAYQFKHSATQEVAYNLMLFSQRRDLHEAIARWYERNFVYDLSPFNLFLAHHWKMAEVVSSAVDYLEKAAQQALRGGNFREVIDALEEAIVLQPESNHSRQIRWAIYTAEAHWGMGNLHESRLTAERVLALLDMPHPSGHRQLLVGLANQVLRQILHRIWPERFVGKITENPRLLLQGVGAYRRLQEVAYLSNQRLQASYAGFRSLNLAETISTESPEKAATYANTGVGMGTIRRHGMAEHFLHQAQAIAERLDDKWSLALTLSRIGIYRASQGQWDTAMQAFDQSIQIYDQIVDRRGYGDSLAASGFAAFLRGQFMHSHNRYIALQQAVGNTRNREHVAWSLSGRGTIALVFGQNEQALTLLQSANNLLKDLSDQLAFLNNLGMLAIAHLRNDDRQQAETIANETLLTITKQPPLGYVAFGGYVYVPDVYLTLWETTNNTRFASKVRNSLKALKRFANVFPVGCPRFRLHQGRYHWLQGKPTKAYTAWDMALRHAHDLDMPYESALVHYHIGRTLDDSDPIRRHHLEKAIGIFMHLGATYDLSVAQPSILQAESTPPLPTA